MNRGVVAGITCCANVSGGSRGESPLRNEEEEEFMEWLEATDFIA